MSYEEKYKESIKSADLLYEEKLYNSAVNRYYYCIYQYILEYNDNNNITLDNEKINNSGSHIETIKLFCKIYSINNNNIKPIRRKIEALKSLRRKADYDKELIDEKEANKAKTFFTYLKKEFIQEV